MPKNTESLSFKLVVVQPFADYKKGDEVTEEETILEILNSDYGIFVVKVKANGSNK